MIVGELGCFEEVCSKHEWNFDGTWMSWNQSCKTNIGYFVSFFFVNLISITRFYFIWIFESEWVTPASFSVVLWWSYSVTNSTISQRRLNSSEYLRLEWSKQKTNWIDSKAKTRKQSLHRIYLNHSLWIRNAKRWMNMEIREWKNVEKMKPLKASRNKGRKKN